MSDDHLRLEPVDPERSDELDERFDGVLRRNVEDAVTVPTKRRLWWYVGSALVLLLFLVVMAAMTPGLLGSSDAARETSSEPSTAATPASTDELIVSCERPYSWDRRPNVTYEEGSRGTRTVGTVEVINTSSEPIVLWYYRSAYNGTDDVSLAWQGGHRLEPDEGWEVPASHAVFTDGRSPNQTWIVPYYAYAVSAAAECMPIHDAAAPDVESGTRGRPVALTFGPEEPWWPDSPPMTIGP